MGINCTSVCSVAVLLMSATGFAFIATKVCRSFEKIAGLGLRTPRETSSSVE